MKTPQAFVEISSEIGKMNREHATKFASLSLDKSERLINLNMQSGKLALAQTITGAAAVAKAKSPDELFALQAKLAAASTQYATQYSRSLYEVAQEAQADFSALAEGAWQAYSKKVTSIVDNAAQNAPAGSDVAIAALRSALAATTSTVEQFTKATQQAVKFAEAGVRAASDAVSAGTGSAPSRNK